MYDYDSRTYTVRRKRSKNKILTLFLFFLVASGGVFFLMNLDKREHVQASESKSAVEGIADMVKKVTNKNEELTTIVDEELQGAQGTYAVVIENEKTGESYKKNEHLVYDAASLYKLWIMAAVYQQIEQGKLKENDSLHADISKLNKKFHIATEAAEFNEGEIDFTVGSALQQMITISHNYAALSLVEKIKLSTVKSFLAKEGFTESTLGSDNSGPTTTASDIALFYKKLSHGELANPEHTQQMLTLLKKQRLNTKLPKYLPQGVIIAHKTGELGMMTHDAGIVYVPDGDYRIVVLSKSSYPPGAKERIGQLSKSVYEYMTAK